MKRKCIKLPNPSSRSTTRTTLDAYKEMDQMLEAMKDEIDHENTNALSIEQFHSENPELIPNVDDIKLTTKKRGDYINWDEMFMGMALLAAKRSKDPYIQVGAVIVNEDKVIVGVGYNGMPVGCSDNVFPWGKDSKNPLDNKQFYVCHAEMNAILNKNCSSIRGSTIYTSYFPCNECAKLIIQSKIARIIFMVEKPQKPETIAAKKMLDAVGIKYLCVFQINIFFTALLATAQLVLLLYLGL